MAAQAVNYIKAGSLEDLQVAVNAHLADNDTHVVVGQPVFDAGSGNWYQSTSGDAE